MTARLPRLASTEAHMATGRYCWSCHRRQPGNGLTVGHTGCGECGHLWRTGAHLMVHHAWVHARLWWVDWRRRRGGTWTEPPAPWPDGWPRTRLWHLVRAFRRPSRIWVCPCCAHDL